MGERKLRAAMALSLVIGVAACSGGPGATTGASEEASAAPTVAAASEAATAAATEVAFPTNTAAPTSLDPCQLVTQSEASTLLGATASAGVSSEVSANVKLCGYQAGTAALDVEVAVAPDQGTLQTSEQAGLSELQKSAGFGLTTADVANLGDKAELVTGSQSANGQTINVGAIYVVKGLTFFAISDVALNAAAPTGDALQAQATTTLTRIP